MAIAFAITAPLQTASIDASPTTRPTLTASRGMPALAEFEPIYAAVQRPPTTDPAAAAQEVLVPADPAPAVTGDRPPLTLVGTIGQSLAMLRNDRGEVELKAVGETVAGATVTSIQTSRVEVQHNGRSIVLEKPRDPNAGS